MTAFGRSGAFEVIGKPIPRVEGPDKVTGRALYAADVIPPNTLWATTVRSPHAHARIVSIDTSRARGVPGVRSVLTASDIPYKLTGRSLKDQPVLCRDRVRFVGDRVAVVAAEDQATAEEAALLVDVDYEQLPAVFDPLAAMEPGAPSIHPDPQMYAGFHHAIPRDLPNLCGYRLHTQGDVDSAFATADLVLEHTFVTQLSHQGYLEPHACLVAIGDDGRVMVWASHKLPYPLRETLAELADLSVHDIRIHPITVGGDFGSKGAPADIPAAYHLARATGRPIKFVASAHADLVAMSHRHPSVVTVRSGVKADGTIVARHARVVYNTGAYGALKPSEDGMLTGLDYSAGPYEIPNLHLEGFCVYTNQPPAGYMRAPGHPQVLFAVEGHMDLLARELGLDPLEFRLKNVTREVAGGGRSFAAEVLRTAAETIGWSDPRPLAGGRLVGRGLAITARGTGFGEGTGDVTVNPDGTVTVLTGVSDNGTGAPTVVAQVAAEVLGAPIERVRVVRASTDDLPIDIGAAADRMTNVAGHAVMAAAEKVVEQLTPLAAAMIGSHDLRWERGRWTAVDGRQVSLDEVAAEMLPPGEPAGHAQVTLSQPRSPDRGACAQAAEVEVDVETGGVRVRKFASVHEVGGIINALAHQGQIEGGVVQGLGYALSEELMLDEDGSLSSAHLGEYKLPTTRDVPPLATAHVQAGTGPGPFNAKGIGEMACVPVAGAIANAVADAIGAPVFRLPITAEQVLEVIDARPER